VKYCFKYNIILYFIFIFVLIIKPCFFLYMEHVGDVYHPLLLVIRKIYIIFLKIPVHYWPDNSRNAGTSSQYGKKKMC